jgi:hypothetical protein
MFSGLRTSGPRKSREEAEKPFWISFSDLMSALMVLFLVALSVALLAVTKKVSEEEREDKARVEAIAAFMDDIKKVVSEKEFEGVRVIDNTIDFGPRGRFEREGQNVLSGPQRQLLRQFTPKLLERLRSTDAGKNWFKRGVVEGYASQSGKYLFNLNLSLERSERVLCELLREPSNGDAALSEADRRLIATKFFVGGASFNSLLSTPEDSRRIEFKLEFKSRLERREDLARPGPGTDEVALAAALDPKERCPIIDRPGT